MADLKRKGDSAELIVAADLVRRGHKIALPFGEDCDYDLIVDRDGSLERVQVKYATGSEEIVPVRCKSLSLTKGKVKTVKRYTAETIDWLAVYHATSRRCFYLPASELGSGRDMLHLRLSPARNGQRIGIRFADDYEDFPPRIMDQLQI